MYLSINQSNYNKSLDSQGANQWAYENLQNAILLYELESPVIVPFPLKPTPNTSEILRISEILNKQILDPKTETSDAKNYLNHCCTLKK